VILAVETSCDETAVALVHRGRVLADAVSSQIQLHEAYGGVVPELAAREHLRNLLPLARAALQQSGIELRAVDAVAATRGPGLPGALLVGVKAAQAMAFALRKPFLGIQHHEAHLYSPWISGDPPTADLNAFRPNVALIVSGGHTLLLHVRAVLDHGVLGSTLDDAAGECFDKVGKLLGLAYPAGPVMDRLAREGNPAAYDFPRPKLRDADDDFSFSGLKTSVRYFLNKHPGLADDPQPLRDLCASVQAAIVEVLVAKTVRAAKRCRVDCITAAGGVTCNSALRHQLAEACRRDGLMLRLAPAALCTDNAAMVGVLAECKLAAGQGIESVDTEPAPGLALR
jgi:N6-L-threonylcarbamoyladenine synthase